MSAGRPPTHPTDWPRCCAVIIPCHNEAAAIAEVVRAARRRLPHVIVVDDGSTDATARLAADAGAEVLRPLVAVMIGGAVTSALVMVIVVPVLYLAFAPPRRRDGRPEPTATPPLGGRDRERRTVGVA